MSKKIQYQIDILEEKLKIYNDIILNLNIKKTAVEKDISIANNNENIDNFKINKNLENEKIVLESKQQIIKQTISKTSSEIQSYESDIININIMHENNLNNEDIILKEELLRIEEQKKNVIEENIKKLELAFIDKQNLYNDIEIIKNELEIQNNYISEIQISLHSSRKQTLEELHNKKQNRIINSQSIDNYKITESIFNDQIIELETINLEIIDFKKNIIDFQYNNEDNTKLTNYYKKYNLDINLSINEKITILDNILNNNNNKINSLNLKYVKQKNKNDIRIKDIVDTYNKSNRIKVIGYKDQFKIEKEKRTNLENILKTLTDKYDTFDSIIINNINNDLINANNELEDDISRSDDRLNIMKLRIIDEYTYELNNKINLIENNKNKLVDLSNEFNDTIVELDNIKDNIKKLNYIRIEIDNLNSEIKKYEDIIQQIILDINKLSIQL